MARPQRPATLAALAALLAFSPRRQVCWPRPASAAVPGYVRLAHLSPDTPKVDVWVTSFKGSSFSKVFPAVGYGVLSDYQRLAAGTYTVAMRSPGAEATVSRCSAPTSPSEPGGAYTVAGVGRNADVSLKVLTDDLSRPSAGKGRMRVVQASSVAPVVNVSTTEGTTIVDAATFPSTTEYAEVPAQQWTLQAEAEKAGVAPAEAGVNVKPGAIYTALVLDKGDSAIQLVVHTDAASATGRPVGSVATGAGGAAGALDGTPIRSLALLVSSLALVAYGLRRLRPVTG